jgi:hypothetical protein
MIAAMRITRGCDRTWLQLLLSSSTATTFGCSFSYRRVLQPILVATAPNSELQSHALAAARMRAATISGCSCPSFSSCNSTCLQLLLSSSTATTFGCSFFYRRVLQPILVAAAPNSELQSHALAAARMRAATISGCSCPSFSSCNSTCLQLLVIRSYNREHSQLLLGLSKL